MLNWTFIRQVGPFHWAMRYGSLQFRKRILKKDSQLRLPTGIKITLPRQSTTSTEIYVTNANVDWGAEALFAQFAEPHRDALDIGAHIGYYAAYLAPRVRRVYAFEPDARNISDLRKNAMSANNVEIVQKAVSSEDGSAIFFGGYSSSTGSLNGDVGGAKMEVSVTTIDTFLANHPEINVGLVKTDVEGHDLEALLGMETMVARHQPLILTECEYSEKLSELCERWKYKVFTFLRDRKTMQTHCQQIWFPDSKDLWYKMLFLVPPHLQASFHSLAEGKSLS